MGKRQRDSRLDMSYISRTDTAFYYEIKKLTTAELGCRLVITNNKAPGVFFLENRSDSILFQLSQLL